MPSDMPRCIAAEKGNHRRNIVGGPEAFDGAFFENLFTHAWRRFLLPRRFYETGGDQIDVDVECSELDRGCFHKTGEARLRRVVARSQRAAAMRVDRTDADDLSLLLRAEDCTRRTHVIE